jgi:hypothetical protein
MSRIVSRGDWRLAVRRVLVRTEIIPPLPGLRAA